MSEPSPTFLVQERKQCRVLAVASLGGLLTLLLFSAVPPIGWIYLLAQLSGLGVVIWCGQLLRWRAIKTLAHLLLSLIPVVNWFVMGTVHRALGKEITQPLAEGQTTKAEKTSGTATTMFVVIFAIVGLGLAAIFGGSNDSAQVASPPSEAVAARPPSAPAPLSLEGLEQALAAELNGVVSERKQEIFDAFHPTGRATSAKVHELRITKWKKDRPTNLPEDITEFVVSFTVYWEGPLTTDGFTKIASLYDAEVGRYTRSEILATNGITKDEASEALGFMAGLAIKQALAE